MLLVAAIVLPVLAAAAVGLWFGVHRCCRHCLVLGGVVGPLSPCALYGLPGCVIQAWTFQLPHTCWELHPQVIAPIAVLTDSEQFV